MTKLSLACCLALSATLAACSSVPKAASTATAAPAGGTAVATTASTTPKLICDDTNQIGSHMQAHICLTPEQVEQRQKDSRQAAFDMQHRPEPLSAQGSGGPTPPN